MPRELGARIRKIDAGNEFFERSFGSEARIISHRRLLEPAALSGGREQKVDLLPTLNIDMALPCKIASLAADTIPKSAKTGNNGDGKILLIRVDEAVRVRDEERAKRAFSRS